MTEHRRPLLHRVRRGAAASLVTVLAGCTALFGGNVPQPPCPRAVVVADAQKLTQFREGLGRDLTDVRFEAEIIGLAPVCEYDAAGFVDADVAISMSIARGPAAEGNISHYEYFVAITDSAGKIIAKRVFPVDVAFPEAILRVGVTEEITQRIAYAPEPDASRHRIFVGFQLTRDQLDYVRRR